LTPLGQSLEPVLLAMHDWAVEHAMPGSGGSAHVGDYDVATASARTYPTRPSGP
jgi:DNA-binding HxlR family transcriptional regulator